jgi:hypothetical protein
MYNILFEESRDKRMDETGEEELDFGLAKGLLNFDCLMGKKSSHLICMK